MAEKKKVELAEVVRHQGKILVPEGLDLSEAINILIRKRDEEEMTVDLNFWVPGFVWDAALAFYRAAEAKFGFVGEGGMFTGATRIEVQVSSTETASVPWGQFKLPGITGSLALGMKNHQGEPGMSIAYHTQRKFEPVIKELVELVKAELKKGSIYRGKAFKAKFYDDEGTLLEIPEIKFLDLKDGIRPIFSRDVESAVQTSILTPIERREECRKLGVPLKRGVLLSGTYGTGKTLVSHLAARKAVENGWTFVYCEQASELSDCVAFAQQYAPAVIFCEDIDRSAQGERTVALDDLLNIVDGIESKGSEVMTILTTNHVETINKAMLRPGRLDAVIHVAPPDAEAVERLFRAYGGDLIPDNADLSEAAGILAGNVPAVIRECVERSKLAALSLAREGDPLVISGPALLIAAESMQNQLDLMKSSEGKPTPEVVARLASALGEVADFAVTTLKPSSNGHKEAND